MLLYYNIRTLFSVSKKEAFMRKFLSFLVGAVLGGLAGATTAILLAPAAGSDLRIQLRDRALRIQEEVKAAAAARRIELEQQLAALRAPRKAE
jgi:gas vesicle protein